MLTPEGTGSTVPAALKPKFDSTLLKEDNWGEGRGEGRGEEGRDNAGDTICSDVTPLEH